MRGIRFFLIDDGCFPPQDVPVFTADYWSGGFKVDPTPANYAFFCAQIEAESELQSLQARLDDMTEKYHRAVAEQETVDSAPLREERVRYLKCVPTLPTALHDIKNNTSTCSTCDILTYIHTPGVLSRLVAHRDRNALRRSSRELHVPTAASCLLWRRLLQQKRATAKTSGCDWNARRAITRSLWPKPTRSFCRHRRSWTR